MDCHQAFVGKNEHDHLEEVARWVGPNRKLPRWVAVGIEVDDHKRVIGRVEDRRVADAMSPGRAMDLHTLLV